MEELYRFMSGYKHLIGDKVYVLVDNVLQEAYVFERRQELEGDKHIVKSKAKYVITYNSNRLNNISETEVFTDILIAVQTLNLSKSQLSEVCYMRLVEKLTELKQKQSDLDNFITIINQYIR